MIHGEQIEFEEEREKKKQNIFSSLNQFKFEMKEDGKLKNLFSFTYNWLLILISGGMCDCWLNICDKYEQANAKNVGMTI